MDAYKGKKGNGNGHIIRFYRESDLRIRLRVSIKSRLTEEVQPDYVVLTLPIGNPPQENPIREPHKKEQRILQIIDYCSEPRTSSEILSMLGLADKKNLMEVYINPMIAENLLSMTEPSNPTSRNQMYVATKTKKF